MVFISSITALRLVVKPFRLSNAVRKLTSDTLIETYRLKRPYLLLLDGSACTVVERQNAPLAFLRNTADDSARQGAIRYDGHPFTFSLATDHT